jgi:hypothetical protein
MIISPVTLTHSLSDDWKVFPWRIIENLDPNFLKQQLLEGGVQAKNEQFHGNMTGLSKFIQPSREIFSVWNYGEAVGRNLWPQKQHDSIPMKYDIDVYNLVHKIKYVTSPRLETNAAPILSWFPCNILIACRHYNGGWPDLLPSNARQTTAPAIATTTCTCMME